MEEQDREASAHITLQSCDRLIPLVSKAKASQELHQPRDGGVAVGDEGCSFGAKGAILAELSDETCPPFV